jgi:hypothetical protein
MLTTMPLLPYSVIAMYVLVKKACLKMQSIDYFVPDIALILGSSSLAFTRTSER